MGKLAVPEYILNKPGKLTSANSKKMKLHAAVGADILSAIDFPYPVVPIVRHHHENWNGSGYPDGLRGTDIPMGARILAVVDCFDALTSDRPYRPRLSTEDALAILLERRGTMYDPLIVDTFTRVHDQIVPDPSPDAVSKGALPELGALSHLSTEGTVGLDNIASSSDEMLTLYELARDLVGQPSVGGAAEAVAKHLRRLIPFSLAVLFVHDLSTDELVAKHAIGDAAPVVKGLTISLGQRLSGWVAANRQTIVNSDPSLDLGEVARRAVPRLRSCLSPPLVCGGQLVGVLSLYSGAINGFSDDHRRIAEAVARQTAQTFQAATQSETDKRDDVAELPTTRQLESLVQSDSRHKGTARLVLLEILASEGDDAPRDQFFREHVLKHAAQHARIELKEGDLLFRSDGGGLGVLIGPRNPIAPSDLVNRIKAGLDSHPFVKRDGTVISVDLQWAAVTVDSGGVTLTEAISAARQRSFGHISASSSRNVH